MPRLVVSIDVLPPEGQSFDLRVATADLDQALAAAELADVQADAPLEASVQVLPSGADVFVLGRLRGRVRCACVRCLAEFETDVAEPFHITFVREGHGADAGEAEIHREDLDAELLPGGEIDLTGIVLEQFFLALPAHPVCRESCRGLCPTCGADRNQSDCGCPDANQDPRFAVLAERRKERSG
ncbi:MAG: YceD family protein [Deferrisomatales bacterium]